MTETANENPFPGAVRLDSDAADAVLAQMEVILADPLFSETTRMKRFLRYIVDETLNGRAGLLKGYSIGLEVFDKPDNFDPQVNTIVRVQAGQLRRRLDRYYAGTGRNDSVRIMVPKGNYIPHFEIRGDDRPQDSAPEGAEIHQFRRQALVKPVGPQVFIRDFEAIMGGTEDTAFARGLTADILNSLTRFRYLRVIYCGDTKTPIGGAAPKITPETGFILNGSVRRVGEGMRVTARLIDAATGDNVFTQKHDRDYTLDSLLELQDSLSSYIAAAVGAPYGVVNRMTRARAVSNARDMVNYEAILNFYAFVRSGSPDEYENIHAQLSAVTQRHAEYSAGWGALSLLESFQASQNLTIDNRDELLARALEHAKKACEIDSRDSLAFLALFTAQFHLGDIDGYQTAARAALALNPNDDHLLGFYAVTLACLGETDAANSFMQRALEHNLNPPDWYRFPGFFELWQTKQYAKLAETISERLDGDFIWGLALIKSALGHSKNGRAVRDFVTGHPGLSAQSTPLMEAMLKCWNFNDDVEARLSEGWALADEYLSGSVP